jgi:hypothetical protein
MADFAEMGWCLYSLREEGDGAKQLCAGDGQRRPYSASLLEYLYSQVPLRRKQQNV